MGYRIDRNVSVSVEIRRVLGEQLGRAAVELRVPGGPDAEAVHEVRKRLKKARSVVRLARADLGGAVANHANAELRRVAADLATQRDADALVETVDRLAAAASDRGSPDRATLDAVTSLRSRLAARAATARAAGDLDRATVLGAARVLDQLVTWIDLVPPKADGWDAVGSGFEREYRRGRNAFRDLGDHPSDEQLHDWRKRVKDLWYHERLLRHLWPPVQRPIVAAAGDLATALGDDHDLAVLVGLVRQLSATDNGDGNGNGGGPAVELTDDERDLVTAAAHAERERLQARARRLGVLLYADAPEAWASRHQVWWNSWATPASAPAST